MKKKALNLTLHSGIKRQAEQIMRKRHYSSLSVLIEELIRERYVQVFGPEDPVNAPDLEREIVDRGISSLKAEVSGESDGTSQRPESAPTAAATSQPTGSAQSPTTPAGAAATKAPGRTRMARARRKT